MYYASLPICLDRLLFETLANTIAMRVTNIIYESLVHNFAIFTMSSRYRYRHTQFVKIERRVGGMSDVSSECCGNRTRAQVAFEQVDWHVGDIWYTLHVCETTNDRLPKDNSTITDCRVLGHFSHFYSACRMYVRMYFQRYTKIDLSWRNIEIEIEVAIESRD